MLAMAEDARERVPVRVDVGGASLVESEAREGKRVARGEDVRRVVVGEGGGGGEVVEGPGSEKMSMPRHPPLPFHRSMLSMPSQEEERLRGRDLYLRVCGGQDLGGRGLEFLKICPRRREGCALRLRAGVEWIEKGR